MPDVAVLDNPVWHALSGPQATVAERDGRALRFDPELAPFAALPDDATQADWDALRALVGPAGLAVIVRDTIDPPPDWKTVFAAGGAQMVWDGDRGAGHGSRSPEVEVLTVADVPDMLDLVERTQPGPIRERTIELGTYVGIRAEGVLVAMAGVRMHPPGFTEVSAVCTDDAHRGRGLASVLVGCLVEEITARGETPCLHAVINNVTAIRLYEKIGFTLRRELPFAALSPRSP
jgi:ribosomal protein S18 acetylase RimI-like enzyme